MDVSSLRGVREQKKKTAFLKDKCRKFLVLLLFW